MNEEQRPEKSAATRRRRRRRRRRPSSAENTGSLSVAEDASETDGSPGSAPARDKKKAPAESAELLEVSGVLELRKDGTGFLRSPQKNLETQKKDPIVPTQLVRKFQLKGGSEITGKATPGPKGPRMKHVDLVDGLEISEHRKRKGFKRLTVIDPDFHYELGPCEQEGQLSMRILDLLCPLGRGQRALLVAPPRSGKTTVMQEIAKAIEDLYPDVHLMVLLVDERPEEATYWKRAVNRGEVYVSTLDESPKNHVRLVEAVQARAERLVEAGREVVILLDSITRMARAYNHVIGNSGKTLSGGLDARTMSKPKSFFGAARNTEDGGSLTIIGTCLVDTGSRMDQVIFEEFKGTGNMELVLDRRLADRRIFPAIAVDRTGTRKEERLLSRQTMRKVGILRRVLSRMRPIEAIELLVDRLEKFPSNRDFLNAFSIEDVE